MDLPLASFIRTDLRIQSLRIRVPLAISLVLSFLCLSTFEIHICWSEVA